MLYVRINRVPHPVDSAEQITQAQRALQCAIVYGPHSCEIAVPVRYSAYEIGDPRMDGVDKPFTGAFLYADARGLTEPESDVAAPLIYGTEELDARGFTTQTDVSFKVKRTKARSVESVLIVGGEAFPLNVPDMLELAAMLHRAVRRALESTDAPLLGVCTLAVAAQKKKKGKKS